MMRIGNVHFHHTPDEWETLDMAIVKTMPTDKLVIIIEQLVHDIKAFERINNNENPLPESMGR